MNLHAPTHSVVGALSRITFSGSMCFVELAETHIPLACERSVSLHDKISRDIDRRLVTDMSAEKAKSQRPRTRLSIFL